MSVDIRRTQLQTGTASYVLINDGSGVISEEQRLAVVRGGTGVNGSTAGNGTLLIGNGSGYTLANITQGSNQGVTITNGSGSIALETVQDIRSSATPGFTQVTVSNDPSSSGHVVNLSYLNTIFSRLRLRTSCRVATTAALPTNIYSNGTAGVGATLTGSSNGALAAVDGVTLVVGNRLLVKNEAAGENNGIYEVTTVGDGSNPYVITRVTDTDTTLEFPGASVEITAGSTLSGTQWGCVTTSPTVGTTPLVFVRFYGVGFYTADDSTLELVGMSFNVKAGGITNTQVNASAAIAYSKLALTGTIVNADISVSAAIAYSKLALTGAIVNADISGSAGIDYSKLALTSSIVNADISGSAAIAYSKLALTNSIVNADISSSAAIAYSKLNLTTSILNADINAGAAIAFSKLANVSATQRVLGRNSGGAGAIEEVTVTQLLDWIGSTRGSVLYRGASGWAALTPGTSGDVLTSNGAGADPSYVTPSTAGSTSSLNHGILNAKATLSGTTLSIDTQSASIDADNPIRVAFPLANGTLQWVNITSAPSMVLPSATFTRAFSVMGFTNTDGVSTLPLSGNAVDVIFYTYLIYDSNGGGTPYMGISRSPHHTQMPQNYWHTPSSSGMTAVGTDTDALQTSTTSLTIGTGAKVFTLNASGYEKYWFADPTRRVRAYSAGGSANFMEGTITSYSGTTLTLSIDLTGGSGTLNDWNIAPRSYAWSWDDMIISKAGALSDAAAPCICIGPLFYGTISGSTGRFSAMGLTLGEFPKWNNRESPWRYKAADGSAQNGLYINEQHWDTYSGYGSTDNKIRKATNNTQSMGVAISSLISGGASSSGAIGGTEHVFTEPGDYAYTYQDNLNIRARIGISLNSAQRTTSVDLITQATLIAVAICDDGNDDVILPRTFYHHAGDIIRAHTTGDASGAGEAGQFLIKKIGWGR